MKIYCSESPAEVPYILAEDVEFPEWIERDQFVEGRVHLEEDEIVWVCSINDLCRGGCSSGCYMPAVTYSSARATMDRYGDDVLAYIWEQLGEVPGVPFETTYPSWSNIASYYLSLAVELWASGVCSEIEQAEEADEEDYSE